MPKIKLREATAGSFKPGKINNPYGRKGKDGSGGHFSTLRGITQRRKDLCREIYNKLESIDPKTELTVFQTLLNTEIEYALSPLSDSRSRQFFINFGYYEPKGEENESLSGEVSREDLERIVLEENKKDNNQLSDE